MPNVREMSQQKTEEVMAYLRAQIESGQWVAGHKLPTEKSLVAQFGAARNTVRKALGKLEHAGLIERHVGRGTFVCGVQEAVNEGDWQEASPAEINELRVLLEPAVAALVVARATKSDIERARQCYENSLKATTIKDFEHWDAELHATIIRAARNNILIKIYDSIGEARKQIEWNEIKRRSLTEVRRGHYDSDHGRIVEALVQRDAAALHDALLNHLTAVSRNMLNP